MNKKEQTPANKGTNGGTIFGIVLGVIFALALVSLITLIVLKRKGYISVRLPLIDSYCFRTSENYVKYSNNDEAEITSESKTQKSIKIELGS